MARSRNIKPSFFTNEELVELPFHTRLLFIGLWTICDREGRAEDRPKRIKMALFPADDINIDACLQELHEAGFILRYEHDGARYFQVLTFNKHQNPHRDERASTIPAPCEHGASTVQAPKQHHGNPADSLSLDSLSLDSLSLDSPIPDPLISETPKPETRNKDMAAPPPGVEVVFEFWRETMGSPRAVLDDKRRKLIRARLKDGYTPDDLMKAIRGCSKSPYHMGLNDRGAKYNSLELILRGAEKVDQFRAYDDDPPVPKGKQAQIEAINRAAGDAFLNDPRGFFDNPEDTIEGEAVHV